MSEDLGWGGGQSRRLEARIARLERMLGAVLQHLEVPYDDTEAIRSLVSAEVRGLAESGKVIEAIKVHRRETGAGLAEAKDIVDRLAGR